MEKIGRNAGNNLEAVIKNLTASMGPLLEKLAGTNSEVTLSFQDLTLDTENIKAKISGSITLNAQYVKQPNVEKRAE